MIVIALAFILLFQGAPAARPGVVTGQIRTIEGAPAFAVRVAAYPVPTGTAIPTDGQEYFQFQPATSTALTDNQGRYRLANIPPGRYYILAGAVGEATYYPAGMTNDRATAITMDAGGTVPNIDIKLLKPFGGKVSGRVTANKADAPAKATLSGGKLEELLEVPVASDGAFEFGHVPPGSYLLTLVPQPPGFTAMAVTVGNVDVTGLQLVAPQTRLVTGRIVVQNGPLPRAMLAFSSGLESHVQATINPDLTFRVRLQPSRHQVELEGVPVGYSIASVKVGPQDASKGVVIGNTDVSDVIINVTAPVRLPRVHGTIAGLPNSRLASSKVEISGPIVGSLETAVQQNGSFEFGAVIPGLYRLRLPQVSEFKPMDVVVAGWDTTELQLTVPSR